MTPATCGGEASASNLVLDRVPAAAIWNLGAHVKRVFLPALEIDAFVYNVLDQHWYQQDGFYDLLPVTDTQSIPALGLSLFAQARYRY